METWDQYQFGLRLGDRPQTIVTTTPRPVKIIKDLIKRDGVKVVRGSTFDNAKNLAASALAELKLRYENTRLGRQELYGEILDDVEGALWTREMIEKSRIEKTPVMIRVVVAIDPAVTNSEDSDETGIVTAGMDGQGHYYILADDSLRASPDTWAKEAVVAYKKWKADRIVAETNNGGDMIIMLLRQVDNNVPTKKVTATRGKKLRAEPVSALYEQGRVHHVGYFATLEEQMVSWTSESTESPDRLDALVWALTELSEGSSVVSFFAALSNICTICQTASPKSAIFCVKCNNSLETK